MKCPTPGGLHLCSLKSCWHFEFDHELSPSKSPNCSALGCSTAHPAPSSIAGLSSIRSDPALHTFEQLELSKFQIVAVSVRSGQGSRRNECSSGYTCAGCRLTRHRSKHNPKKVPSLHTVAFNQCGRRAAPRGHASGHPKTFSAFARKHTTATRSLWQTNLNAPGTMVASDDAILAVDSPNFS